MKKKAFSVVLLSTLFLTTFSSAFVKVGADDIDSQITQKNNELNSIKTKEQEAQAQIDTIQSTINGIQEKSAKLKAENDKLQAESAKLGEEIADLGQRTADRSTTIENQARSVQTDGGATNYLSVILESSSISDAIARIQALSKITAANKELLREQKEDLKVTTEKAKKNLEAKATIAKNQEDLQKKEGTLQEQQTQLKVAQLELSITRATTEDDIAGLKQQQADAKEAAERAAEEAAQKPERPSPPGPVDPGPGDYRVGGYTTDNSYYIGQCTWYVKDCFGSYCGDNWGNAGEWAYNARVDRVRVSSTPAVNTIAVFAPGAPGSDATFGHVAVVIGVSGSNITVSEMNYEGVGIISTRVCSSAGVEFIYPYG